MRKYSGGTSMQNKTTRFKSKSSLFSHGPYPAKRPCRLPGKVFIGIPPHNNVTKMSSIPEKGTPSYILTNEGLVKVYNPQENRSLGSTEYYNPEGHCNNSNFRYQGNFWSLRTAQRFRYKENDGPGPADYSVNQNIVTPWQRFQLQVQSKIRANAPLLRSNDLLQQRLCKEKLPGPGSYSPVDPNSKKCNWSKSGTFGASQRQNMYYNSDNPGPADYMDSGTLRSKATSLCQAPFNVTAVQVPESKSKCLPGPADYLPKNTMWDEAQKRKHSKYSKWNAPFDSSSIRNTSLAKYNSCFTPSPDLYFTQLQDTVDEHQSSMFASKTCRFSSKIIEASLGPEVYSLTDAFKISSAQKSHLKNTKSAFLTSSSRLEPFKFSCSPAPTTYKLSSTLNNKGCSVGVKHAQRVRDVIPGPSHYTIHPKYAKSSVFGTHNATLLPPENKIPNLLKANMTKVLRSFVTNA